MSGSGTHIKALSLWLQSPSAFSDAENVSQFAREAMKILTEWKLSRKGESEPSMYWLSIKDWKTQAEL